MFAPQAFSSGENCCRVATTSSLLRKHRGHHEVVDEESTLIATQKVLAATQSQACSHRAARFLLASRSLRRALLRSSG